MHTTELDYPVLEQEEGLLLGNGDLSVSIYQASDQIIWRFGKNDVWDRRLDLSDSPKPAHIDEIARGVKDEGWVNSGFLDGHGHAGQGASDPQRMREICDGWPAYARRPYPCPKPVGELALHLPADQSGFRIRQRLTIEQNTVAIRCSWDSGAVIDLECFVPPSPNVLVVTWTVENWTVETATATQVPVWFSLYRWNDPTIEAFVSDLFARTRFQALPGAINTGRTSPLPVPIVRDVDGQPIIEQSFPPDLRFAGGFRYYLAPFVTGLTLEAIKPSASNEARLHIKGDSAVLEGVLAVAVPTSTDAGGADAELARIVATLHKAPVEVIRQWRQDTEMGAQAFWRRSSVSIADTFMERVWYETLHVRRCAYRSDVIAPGLMMPSTVGDYSLWHGDYHTNYNYQSPFWGDYSANQVDLGDAFFPGMRHIIENGRKLARDWGDCRGTFIQLTGYPFEIEGDPYGTGPLSRLAYMTGWIAGHYWWRYVFTMDTEWLADEGYPVIRDCAQFYTDFLEKWDDDLYHAFPSGQGESFFTGSSADYTDRPQVIRHIRFCLQMALEAAQILDTDSDLAQQWRERLDRLVMVDDLDALSFSDEERRRYVLNSPEFISYDEGNIERPGSPPQCLDMSASNPLWRGYFGQFPWKLMIAMRNGVYDADRDFDAVRAHILRWRMPNGAMRGMAAGDWGRTGIFTESLGILAPLQEMMLQSWDGAIRVFPAWPKHQNASFTTLRAEHAFLVSASWRDGSVDMLTVHSVAGGQCRVAIPWDGGMGVYDETDEKIDTTLEPYDIAVFQTRAGNTYHLKCI